MTIEHRQSSEREIKTFERSNEIKLFYIGM